MTAVDPVAEYKRWVLERFSRTQVELVYDPDDVFCEGEPIGSRIVNLAEQHCKQFDDWIKLLTAEGYVIKPAAW